jgi:hypothetical protein
MENFKCKDLSYSKNSENNYNYPQQHDAVADPIKLYFFTNKEFFRYTLLS